MSTTDTRPTMKRLSAILIAAFALTVLVPTGATAVSAGTNMWVTAKELDLRAGPSSSHPVTVTGLTDARAVATGNSKGDWVEVNIAGTRAWTPERFLTTSKPSWDPRRVTVTAASLGLRSGPLGTYPVTVTAKRGTKGIFTGVIKNGWWEVKIGSTYAWTPARFLETASNSTSKPPSNSSPKPTPGAHKGNVWVTAYNLGLRSGPLGTYPVTINAREDSRGVATGKTANGWAEVRIGGITAWTPQKFLTTRKPAWDPIRVTVTASSLGLRSGPLGKYPVTVTAKRGTPGIFTGLERNGWWEVKVNGTFAWTPARFVVVGGLFDVNDVMRVAHSQVGYREPSWRNNKYNSWINGDQAWCAVFVSWVFDQAGYPEGVPKTKHYDDFVADLRRSGVLDTSVTAGELKRGDVVLVDWVPRNGPTHAGIVDRVDGSSVWLVEGNTTSGTGDQGRGVFHRKRAIADMHASFTPSDYALATR